MSWAWALWARVILKWTEACQYHPENWNSSCSPKKVAHLNKNWSRSHQYSLLRFWRHSLPGYLSSSAKIGFTVWKSQPLSREQWDAILMKRNKPMPTLFLLGLSFQLQQIHKTITGKQILTGTSYPLSFLSFLRSKTMLMQPRAAKESWFFSLSFSPSPSPFNLEIFVLHSQMKRAYSRKPQKFCCCGKILCFRLRNLYKINLRYLYSFIFFSWNWTYYSLNSSCLFPIELNILASP